MVVIVNCKRCGVKMAKWQRSPEDEASKPFPFDSICGRCITTEKAKRGYPLAYKKISYDLGKK
jgi:ribosomal protein S27AE